MLYLSRKEGESIIINNTIEVTVMEIRGRTVKLGFTFPPEASILRKEVYERIRQQNLAAATGKGDDSDAFGVTITLKRTPDEPDNKS